MKTIAQTILESCDSFASATNLANTLAKESEQDWNSESTIFIFNDNSALKAEYPIVELIERGAL